MENFTLEKIKGLLNAEVTLVDPVSELSIHAIITEVSPEARNGDSVESFLVVLKHNSDMSVSQGILRLQHPQIGEEDLFVNPLSDTEIQIVVNRQ